MERTGRGKKDKSVCLFVFSGFFFFGSFRRGKKKNECFSCASLYAWFLIKGPVKPTIAFFFFFFNSSFFFFTVLINGHSVCFCCAFQSCKHVFFFFFCGVFFFFFLFKGQAVWHKSQTTFFCALDESTNEVIGEARSSKKKK